MLFNSFSFLAFFPIVVLFYWVLPYRYKNIFLLIASYYFYMNWEPIYALLIFGSTFITWCSGRLMTRYPDKKKVVLSVCVIVNLAILFLYKYANFFNTAIHDGLSFLGIGIDIPQFDLLLPVGISFYTFQALGYSIDVYRGTIKAERSLLTYALFVSFFPQLVAGPIERASNLLPQFHYKHVFSGQQCINGLQMMLWGYFMKLCIADNVSTYVDAVFEHLHNHSGTSIALASVFFSFQILSDFGGYSLIAIGCAHCMGFKLMQNFRQPFLATSIKDHWRRWHISLSTWFTDYVYIPLGGNRVSSLKHKRNIFVTFLVSGLWHGANYTYIVWGMYNGVLQVIQAYYNEVKKKYLPGLSRFDTKRGITPLRIIWWLGTYMMLLVGYIIFRAKNISDAVYAVKKIATDHGPLYNGAGKPALVLSILLIAVLFCREVITEYRERRGKPTATASNMFTGILASGLLLVIILLCGNFEGGQFIYFQF